MRFIIALLLGAFLPSLPAVVLAGGGGTPGRDRIPLPDPVRRGTVSVEEAMNSRRSIREFRAAPLTDAQVGQLCWALQGITSAEGRRTAPSAGARYPMEVLVALPEGLYRYEPARHHLVRVGTHGDLRPALAGAAFDQGAVASAAAVFVVVAEPAKTEARYGPSRTPRYLAMEAGHAAQNLHLQAVALGLGSVPVGAFEDGAVARVLGLPGDRAPLYLLPVGRP